MVQVAVLRECLKVLRKLWRTHPDKKVPAASGRYRVTLDDGTAVLRFAKDEGSWWTGSPETGMKCVGRGRRIRLAHQKHDRTIARWAKTG